MAYQEKLADLADISLNTMARLERHHRSLCRTYTLARLAAAPGGPAASIGFAAPKDGPIDVHPDRRLLERQHVARDHLALCLINGSGQRRLPRDPSTTVVDRDHVWRAPTQVDTGAVRQAFVHDAVVTMEAGGDVRALGAAITVALCGHWEHEPPCPLAPHSTDVQRSGNEVRLRVLFATEPAAEAEVRSRIEVALSQASLDGPDGVTTRWQFRSAQPGLVLADEAGHAERLIRT